MAVGSGEGSSSRREGGGEGVERAGLEVGNELDWGWG